MNTKEKEISCVGMIMDGNRRWAKKQGLSSIQGHKAGYENLKRVTQWCREEEVAHLVVYAFSTENWNRAKEEVDYLMEMMRFLLKDEIYELREDDVAVHIIGQISLFPEDVQKLTEEMHASNPNDAKYHLWIAASYGGRAEIVAGVNSLLQEGEAVVTEELFAKSLWTADMPDPEIVIRTGGEKRLSNFLSWSCAYSELFFIDTFWPAFSKEEFVEILEKYRNRKRNFGK